MSQQFTVFILAVSAFALAFCCQSPTIQIPGERGPMGPTGTPGNPQQVDVMLRNSSVFLPVTTGKRKRSIEIAQVVLHFEDIPVEDLESTVNQYITEVVEIAQENSPKKLRTNEIFFETVDAIRDGNNFDVYFPFRKESAKNCKTYIEAVKKVNRSIGKLQTISMSCEGQNY